MLLSCSAGRVFESCGFSLGFLFLAWGTLCGGPPVNLILAALFEPTSPPRNLPSRHVFDPPWMIPETSPGHLLEARMKLHSLNFRSFFGKAALATAALGGFLLFAGAPSAKANDWDNCNRRATYTDYRYDQAARFYGPYSRQARYWAHERHEAYERVEHYRHEWREHHRYDRDWDRR